MDKTKNEKEKMNEFSAHEIKIIKNEFAKYSKTESNPEQIKKIEKFFDRILKNNNAIKLLVNVETNKIENSNKYAQKFYGYSEHELHSKKIFEINVLKGDEVKAEYIRSKELGRDYFESKQKNAKGEVKNVMVRSTSLSIKEKNYVYLIIHELPDDENIDEKKEKKPIAPIFSLSIPTVNSGFEDEYNSVEKDAKDLVTLSNRLAESEEELKQLNASKDRFFSIISHDLKNGFYSVLELSKMLADPENTDSEEEKLETAQRLHNSSKKVYSFLENLLSWARLQRGKMDFEPTENSLYAMVTEVVYLFKHRAEQSGVKLQNNIGSNSIVFCDENMVKTILRNLISNALNFTNPNDTIGIDAQNRDEEIVITVSDTGVGITDENIKKLFRVDSKYIATNTQGEKGTGLGLILCKEFVEKNKGKIWVESKEGEGSKFSFTLPKSKLDNYRLK